MNKSMDRQNSRGRLLATQSFAGPNQSGATSLMATISRIRRTSTQAEEAALQHSQASNVGNSDGADEEILSLTNKQAKSGGNLLGGSTSTNVLYSGGTMSSVAPTRQRMWTKSKTAAPAFAVARRQLTTADGSTSEAADLMKYDVLNSTNQRQPHSSEVTIPHATGSSSAGNLLSKRPPSRPPSGSQGILLENTKNANNSNSGVYDPTLNNSKSPVNNLQKMHASSSVDSYQSRTSVSRTQAKQGSTVNSPALPHMVSNASTPTKTRLHPIEARRTSAMLQSSGNSIPTLSQLAQVGLQNGSKATNGSEPSSTPRAANSSAAIPNKSRLRDGTGRSVSEHSWKDGKHNILPDHASAGSHGNHNSADLDAATQFHSASIRGNMLENFFQATAMSREGHSSSSLTPQNVGQTLSGNVTQRMIRASAVQNLFNCMYFVTIISIVSTRGYSMKMTACVFFYLQWQLSRICYQWAFWSIVPLYLSIPLSWLLSETALSSFTSSIIILLVFQTTLHLHTFHRHLRFHLSISCILNLATFIIFQIMFRDQNETVKCDSASSLSFMRNMICLLSGNVTVMNWDEIGILTLALLTVFIMNDSMVVYMRNNLMRLVARNKMMDELAANNAELKTELQGIMKQDAEAKELIRQKQDKIDVMSPLARVLDELQKIRNETSDAEVTATLDIVMRILFTNDFFQPQEIAENADDQVQGFLRTLMIAGRDDTVAAKSGSAIPPSNNTSMPSNATSRKIYGTASFTDNQSDGSEASAGGTMTKAINSRTRFGSTAQSLRSHQDTSKLMEDWLIPDEVALCHFLDNHLGKWDCDMITVNELSRGHALYFGAMAIFRQFDFCRLFRMSEARLVSFLCEVELGYTDSTPYHNSVHSADVLHCMYYFIECEAFRDRLTMEERLAAIVAAIVHDFRHFGLSNAFLNAAQHTLALRYNDQATLENFHVASAFELLMESENNIYSDMSNDLYRLQREYIIAMVMATDMAQHFEFISKFKSKLSAGGIDWDNKNDRKLVLSMLMKASDINNPGKPWNLSKTWTFQITEEFFRQGDLEKSRGMPVSAFMGRESTEIPKSQVSFINYFVVPLYEALRPFIGPSVQEVINNIYSNRDRWANYSGPPINNYQLPNAIHFPMSKLGKNNRTSRKQSVLTALTIASRRASLMPSSIGTPGAPTTSSSPVSSPLAFHATASNALSPPNANPASRHPSALNLSLPPTLTNGQVITESHHLGLPMPTAEYANVAAPVEKTSPPSSKHIHDELPTAVFEAATDSILSPPPFAQGLPNIQMNATLTDSNFSLLEANAPLKFDDTNQGNASLIVEDIEEGDRDRYDQDRLLDDDQT